MLFKLSFALIFNNNSCPKTPLKVVEKKVIHIYVIIFFVKRKSNKVKIIGKCTKSKLSKKAITEELSFLKHFFLYVFFIVEKSF
ncbi:hypothetical protein LPB136_00240 [Tenacibaculum todarodis]|uniref:Uncharacterized protein n=1 Tax=Tenacibaculum todarodis TaxID=1850252 RepID=A0A1L3JFI3_9FLAO|nr:hypothetical protein LPB136_00240 [Tenacibaculum todarodis]